MIHHLVGHPLTNQSSLTASDANTIRQYPSSTLSDYRDTDDTFSGKCHLIQISIFKCMSLFYHKELRKNNQTPSSAMHLKSIFFYQHFYKLKPNFMCTQCIDLVDNSTDFHI